MTGPTVSDALYRTKLEDLARLRASHAELVEALEEIARDKGYACYWCPNCEVWIEPKWSGESYCGECKADSSVLVNQETRYEELARAALDHAEELEEAR